MKICATSTRHSWKTSRSGAIALVVAVTSFASRYLAYRLGENPVAIVIVTGLASVLVWFFTAVLLRHPIIVEIRYLQSRLRQLRSS